MSSTVSFRDFVLDGLKDLENIKCRPMMGEYLLYYNDILFGGIYDDRLLVKKTPSCEKYSLFESIPYPNAKPMYMVENLDDSAYLAALIQDICHDL